ncbi:hypothetical protein KDL44_04830 [bacterium]|nr:hypothetical protein [bacterium]
MPQEHEVITLILGLGVMLIIIVQRRQLAQLRHALLLLSACAVSLAAWSFTVLEDLLPGLPFNLLEHTCYLASALLLAIWCRKHLAAEERPA